MEALGLVDDWPADRVAVGVASAHGTLFVHGDAGEFGLASVTKPVTALACLVAAEEGTLDLDEPAGPPGSRVRRIYSEYGFEVLGETLAARAEMPFADYLAAAVLEPLSLGARLDGKPGSGLQGSLGDLLAIGRELLAPTLVSAETLAEATAVQFPGLVGVLPGFGRREPNDWGLGLELRDHKSPHWTGLRNSERTFGHFGSSGTFLWVDPEPGIALACLTDLAFGEWAKAAWPALSDAILAEL